MPSDNFNINNKNVIPSKYILVFDIQIKTKKTAFSFDNIFYEHIDGVSMGSPLAPVLANIIMTELEKTVV